MKNTLILGLAALALTPALTHAAKWESSWHKAVELSKKTKKPILIDFTGSDWCGWCIRLDQEVFDKPEFSKWAAKNVILLKLDFPRKKAMSASQKKHNQALAEKYNVRGFPTILIVKPTGDVLGELGYMEGGPAAWIKEANKTLKG